MTEPTMDDILRQAADELVERQRTVHQRVQCPRCHVPTGTKCVNVSSGRELKHPHTQRLQADGIQLR